MNSMTLLLCTLFAQTAAPADAGMQRIVEKVGLDQHLGAQVPLDLVLRDESGRAVPLRAYCRDKPVILNLVYYRCPMLCTQVLNGLLKSSQAVEPQLDRDYDIVSVSIDPKETPAMAAAKKKRYVGSYHRPGGEEGWHFLTGDKLAIERLARTVGYRYEYDERSGQYAHPSGIMVLTPDGRISRYLYGIDYHPTDLRLALVESSEGKIGTLADQFLLLCYHYDPATGKYGLVIGRVMQAAGLTTLAVLGTFLLVMFRREARRTALFKGSGTSDGQGVSDVRAQSQLADAPAFQRKGSHSP